MVSLEFFSLTQSFRSHYGPGVDVVSNRNEYQEYFLGGKAAENLVSIVLKSGSLNLLESSGPVQVRNGIALPLTFRNRKLPLPTDRRPRGIDFWVREW